MNRLQENTVDRLALREGRLFIRDHYTDHEVRVTGPRGSHWIVAESGVERRAGTDATVFVPEFWNQT